MRFLADENFNNEILRGLLRRVSEVEVVRIQDTELYAQPDPIILEWAVKNEYFVLTHDVNTMRGFFYDRVNAGQKVPGLFLVHGDKPIGEIIEALVLIITASEADEWWGGLHFLPL